MYFCLEFVHLVHTRQPYWYHETTSQKNLEWWVRTFFNTEMRPSNRVSLNHWTCAQLIIITQLSKLCSRHAKSVPQDCQCLSRYKNFYIITGPLYAELLTLQSLLELIRIVKVETEDGGIIGVLVPTNKINTLKKYVSIDPTLWSK